MTNEKIRKLIVSEDRFKELLIIEAEHQFILDNGLECRINGIQKNNQKIDYLKLAKEIARIKKTNYFDKDLSNE